MTPLECRHYLDSFVNYEMINEMDRSVFKLDRVRELLRLFGNPHEKIKCIQIAGTKGKGSTCAFTAFILRQAGYKVGLYSSPHLNDYKERIRVLYPKSNSFSDPFEGKIRDEELCGILEELKDSIDEVRHREDLGRLSFFEVYTAMALYYFHKCDLDFAVLETGLGGRLDATNVVDSLVCGITPISLEHTQYLGNTLAEITWEKAGIIKGRNLNVVTAFQYPEVLEILRKRCQEKEARLFCLGEDFRFELDSFDIHGQLFHVTGLNNEYRRLKTHLLGRHQAENACVAVGIIEALKDLGYPVQEKAVSQGIESTIWPGRFEVVLRNPLVILDGAHNPASMKALVRTVEDVLPHKRITVILGVSVDKDLEGIIGALNAIVNKVIVTRANHPRAYRFSREQIERFWPRGNCLNSENVSQALDMAFNSAGDDEVIVVTGSLFVVGEARETCTSFKI